MTGLLWVLITGLAPAEIASSYTEQGLGSSPPRQLTECETLFSLCLTHCSQPPPGDSANELCLKTIISPQIAAPQGADSLGVTMLMVKPPINHSHHLHTPATRSNHIAQQTQHAHFSPLLCSHVFSLPCAQCQIVWCSDRPPLDSGHTLRLCCHPAPSLETPTKSPSCT